MSIFAVPDTPLAHDAATLVRAAYSESIFNHAARTFQFAAALGGSRGYDMDMELLYVASLFHDLGLTAAYCGPEPFEIQSATAATNFLRERGWSAGRIDVAWDAIVFHCHGAIARHKRAEVATISEATGIDVAGPDSDEVSAAQIEQILRAYPRLNFKHEFIATCAQIAAMYPAAARRTFMEDIAQRHVPGYVPGPNICDLVTAAPYDE